MKCDRCGEPRAKIMRPMPAFMGGGKVERFARCVCVDKDAQADAEIQSTAARALAKRQALAACGVHVKPHRRVFDLAGGMCLKVGVNLIDPRVSGSVGDCIRTARALVWHLASNGQSARYTRGDHEAARLWVPDEQRGLLAAPVLALGDVGAYDPAPWVKDRVVALLRGREGKVTICAMGVPREVIEQRWGESEAKWLYGSAVTTEVV